jgi:hypothetical protein
MKLNALTLRDGTIRTVQLCEFTTGSSSGYSRRLLRIAVQVTLVLRRQFPKYFRAGARGNVLEDFSIRVIAGEALVTNAG